MSSISISRKPLFIDANTVPQGIGSPSIRNEPLYIRKDFLGEHEISMQYNSIHGLVADVKVLTTRDSGKQFTCLPLTGFPKEIAERGVFSQFMKILENSYWVPKKGTDGAYREVAVFPALKGGMNGKIPFQPGLALGSIVRGDIIGKMDSYAKQISELDNLEQQLKSVEQRIKVLELISENEKPVSKKVEENRLRSLKAQIETNITTIGKEEKPIPVFSSLQIGLRSPLDMERSIIVTQPRGFDSLEFRSQYIDFHKREDVIKDQIEQTSLSGSLSVSGGWGLFSGSLSASLAKSTSERVNTIKRSNRSTGILLINSILTTRNVRCFSSLKYDKAALEGLVDIMERPQTRTPEQQQELCQRNGISIENEEPILYILTESMLGGSFTALVTFLNETEMNRKAELLATETGYGGKAEVGHSLVGSVSGSLGRSNAEQSESDFLKQIMGTKIEIEFISQGAIPGFARNVVEREIIQHLSLNPSQFTPSQGDREQAQALISATGNELATLQLQRRMRLEDVQVATINACRGLTETKEAQKVHTPESVLGAYENFARQMSTDKEAGVPIGFNFTRLTLRDIKRELALLSRTSAEEKRG